ncbi:MAG: hypothetical protein NZM37_10100 [Sandaracinaceae bacterium]|nr:hypothetical protein [Sandaracinaceae bacterium]
MPKTLLLVRLCLHALSFMAVFLGGCRERAQAPALPRAMAPKAKTPLASSKGWVPPPEPRPFRPSQAPPPPSPLIVEETLIKSGPDPSTPSPSAPRDLGAELARLIGDPSPCITLEQAEAHSKNNQPISFSVAATVLPSGRLQRAEVRGLPPSSSDCIRKRIEGLSFPQPIEGAPRRISTTLHFDAKVRRSEEVRIGFAPDIPPPGRAQPPALVLPALGPPGPAPGAAPPAFTLPALGPSQPPPGQVPPSYTLPASAESPRPPGYVPPAITLPAQGGAP